MVTFTVAHPQCVRYSLQCPNAQGKAGDKSKSGNPGGGGSLEHSGMSSPRRSPGVGQLLLCGVVWGGGWAVGKFDSHTVTKGQHSSLLELSGLLVLAVCWAWAGPGPPLPNHCCSPKATLTLPLPVETAFSVSFSTIFSSPCKKLQT